MIREILFRGLRKDKNEFVFGDLIHGVNWKKDNLYILPLHENLACLEGCHPLDGYDVIPESVGQFTGILDIKGEKVFENDFINRMIKVPEFEPNINIEIVKYDAPCFRSFNISNTDDTGTELSDYMYHSIEIIGNTTQNPELLK